MKILLSAYACETGRGSEGEIGWRLVLRLAQQHQVVVITRANLRPIHEASFKDQPKPTGLHFVYFDLPWIFRFYKRGKRLFLLYYYFWQIGVGLLARRLNRQQHFDVLHHLIGGMDWMPAGLALCPGRFIWGPVGSENTHPLISRHLPWRSRLKDQLRAAVRWSMRTLDPLVYLTAKRASVILSHTPETMPRRYSTKLRPFVQTGIEDLPSLARSKIALVRNPRLQLIFAGELKDWKGAQLALQAALHFFETESQADLTIIGDGPLRAQLESIAQTHPEGQRVRFLGKLTMEALVNTLHEGDVFLFPSFHHGMSTVVLQAMLTGLPVVCIEGDATGRAIGQEAGITVPLSDTQDPIVALSTALHVLATDEVRRQALGEAARQIARERFSYDHQARALSALYADVMAGNINHE